MSSPDHREQAIHLAMDLASLAAPCEATLPAQARKLLRLAADIFSTYGRPAEALLARETADRLKKATAWPRSRTGVPATIAEAQERYKPKTFGEVSQRPLQVAKEELAVALSQTLSDVLFPCATCGEETMGSRTPCGICGALDPKLLCLPCALCGDLTPRIETKCRACGQDPRAEKMVCPDCEGTGGDWYSRAGSDGWRRCEALGCMLGEVPAPFLSERCRVIDHRDTSDEVKATKPETLARLEALGTIARGCQDPVCLSAYASASGMPCMGGPTHAAKDYCESGKGTHCTCPLCWG